MISQNVEKSIKDSNLINNFLFVNSFSASIFLIVSTVFVHFYNYFLNIEALVGYNPDRIILLSFLACVISSLYYPKLWHVKFSNLESRLLKYLITIFIITLGMFLFLPISTDLFIFYILFELLVYLVSFVLYKTQFPEFKNKLSPSLYISVIIVLLYLNSSSYFYIQLLAYTIFSVFELKKVQVILNSKSFN